MDTQGNRPVGQRLLSAITLISLILTLLSVPPPQMVQAASSSAGPLPAPADAWSPVVESFKCATAAGWQLFGNAALTGNGTTDPSCDGWLRLTSAGTTQSGSAVYNVAIPTGDGFVATFQYADYGGTGADGLSFYLIDGSTVTPTLGYSGGALGYASAAGTNPGVTNGYVGIGFDEYGGFSNPVVGSGGPGANADQVGLRGSGNLLTGFNFLTAFQLDGMTPARTVDGVTRAGARWVRVFVVNNKISVQMDFGAGWQTLINAYDLSTATGQATLPATFKIGFSGSTGALTNYHEIRNLTVAKAATLDVNEVAAPTSAAPGDTVVFTATITNDAMNDVLSATVAAPVPARLSNVAWSCFASAGSTCTASGTGDISETVSLLKNGVLTYTVQGTVNRTAGGLVHALSITPPAEFTNLGNGGDSVNVTLQPELVVDGNLTFIGNHDPLVLAPGLVITAGTVPTLTAARVAVMDNFTATNDRLGISGASGTSGSIGSISWNYNTTTGILWLSGSDTITNYQAALRTVTFDHLIDPKTATTRTVQFVLGSALQFKGNGHFYEEVISTQTWSNARTAAAARLHFGGTGYLATITSAEEDAFAYRLLTSSGGWLGGSDSITEGTWLWMTGPEAGTVFCIGGTGTCVPQNGAYLNWYNTEPSSESGDHYLRYLNTIGGQWSDGSSTTAYIVEYGGMPGDPVLNITGTVSLDLEPDIMSELDVTDEVTYTGKHPGVVIAPTLMISDANGPADTLAAARVFIEDNFDAAVDRLGIEGQSGTSGSVGAIAWSYDTDSGVMSLSGTASITEYQALLRTVTYANLIDFASVESRTVGFVLGSGMPFAGTGHFYEYIASGSISWAGARTAAAARSYFNQQGYLATMTSAQENAFANSKLGGATAWLGGSDSVTETYWMWNAGPEAGTVFCRGNSGNCVPQGGHYTNWNGGEPNDSDGEDYLQFLAGTSGLWNDQDSNLTGYVVEYGGMAGDPVVNITGTATVHMVPDTMSELDVSDEVTYTGKHPGVVIAPTLTITDANGASDVLTTTRVFISRNFDAAFDRLGIQGQSGTSGSVGLFSWSYNTTSGIMAITGTASITQYQEFLRTVTYYNVGDPTVATTRTVGFVLGTVLFFSGNGHFYEQVVSSQLWSAALSAAAGRRHFQQSGYLATITSAEENDFAFDRVSASGAWLGGSDALTDTYWMWKTGPEAGTVFCIGGAGTCASQNGAYINWNSTTEPSGGTNVDYLKFLLAYPGKWFDDAVSASLPAYIVEYGGMAGEPVLNITGEATVHIIPDIMSELDASDEVTYTANHPPLIVAPTLTISDANGDSDVLTTTRVFIGDNFDLNDRLGILGQSGTSGTVGVFSWSYNTVYGIMSITGTASITQYQEFLRTVTYYNVGTPGTATTRTVEFALGNLLAFGDHFYQYVTTAATWTAAETAATTRRHFGMSGYLATITSEAERIFIGAHLLQGQGTAWLGGTTYPANVAATSYRWATGPEGLEDSGNGRIFWVSACGLTLQGVCATTGEYNYWGAGRPQSEVNSGVYLGFSTAELWDDSPKSGSDSYIVEYGGMPGEPVLNITGEALLHVVPDSLSELQVSDEVSYTDKHGAILVAPTLVITDVDGAADVLTTTKVFIDSNFDAANDRLGVLGQGTAISGSTGVLSWSYNTTTGIMAITGTASITYYQEFLRTVTYYNVGTPGAATMRTVQFMMGSMLTFGGTGHFYEYVSSGAITWGNARTAAAARTYQGLQGYLATMTSADENAFANSKLGGAAGWLGGSDAAVEGNWTWVTGPETGNVFCIGNLNCVVQPGFYANWNSDEPNDSGGEDCLQFLAGGTGKWNDLSTSSTGVTGYVVEYGGTTGDPVIHITGTAKLHVLPDTPSELAVSGEVSFTAGYGPVLVAPELTITDADSPADTLSSARVMFGTNFDAANDRLGILGQGSATSGSTGVITWSYNTTTGIMALSGTAPISSYQELLRTVTYYNDAFPSTMTTRTVDFMLGTMLTFGDTGHFYEYVVSSNITWNNAYTAAAARSYLGQRGYLATVLSAEENAFASSKLGGATAWLGANDTAVEGEWRWVTGPEAGTLFCTDVNSGAGGCTDGGVYDNWLSPTQPDNSSNEDYLQFIAGGTGKWNDLPDSGAGVIQGYVVEYGGLAGDPVLHITGQVVVHVLTNADLALTKTAEDLNGEPLYAGDLLRYTLYVTNTGSLTHTGVAVIDQLPAGVSFVSATPGGYIGPNPLNWSLGSLIPGATWTGEILVRVDGATTPLPGNVARISSNQQPQTSTPGILPPGSPDLAPGLVVEKTAEDLNGMPLYVGDTVRYTIRVTNTGTTAMTGVVVTDTLPAGVAFDSATPAGYTGATTLVWNVGTLDVGASWTGEILVHVDGSTTSLDGNVAQVSSNEQGQQGTNPITPPGSTTVMLGLLVSKTAEDLNGMPLYTGDVVRYTVRVTNTGATTMTGVIVTDTLPAGVTLDSATPDDYTGSGTLVWNVGSLEAGETWTLVLLVHVDGTATPIGGNVAQVSSNEQGQHGTQPILPPGSANVLPGLVIAKTAEDINGEPLRRGDTLRYTIRVTNTGTTTMTGVIVTDTLPTGVAFDLATPVGYTGTTTIVWEVGELAPDAEWTGVILVHLAGAETTLGGNVAQVSSNEQGAQGTAPILPPGSPNLIPGLTVSKTAEDFNGEPLYTGDILRYTIRVTNTGATTMTGVIVTDTLPAGVTFDSAAPAGYTGTTVIVWNLGTMAPGASWTGMILVHVDGTATPIGGNVVQVGSNEQGAQSTEPILPPGSSDVVPGMVVSKTAEDLNGTPLYTGDILRYTIRVTNTGTTTMTGVIVTDTLPAGVTFDSATPGGYTGTRVIVWNAGTLAPGAAWTGVLLVHVDGTAMPIGGNVAQVSSNEQGPQGTAPILPPSGGTVTPGLVVSKTAEDVNGYVLYPGDLLRYTIRITNTGTTTMTGVRVTDTLPAGVVFTAATPGGYTGPNPLVWSFASLAAGQSWTAIISVTIAPTVTSIGGNIAQMSSNEQGPQSTGPILPPSGGTVVTNTAPQVQNDLYDVPEGVGTTLAVLANDSDWENDPLTVVGVGAAQHGTVSFISTGVIYTPTTGYLGTDTFTYTVSDGLLQSTAQVTATVTPVADLGVSQTIQTTPSGYRIIIVASNAGPRPAPGAVISDTIPANLVGVNWSCAGTGGVTCAITGTGNLLNETFAAFPVGGVVTYTIMASDATGVPVTNTVTITPPTTMFDTNLANNRSSRLTVYRLVLPMVCRNCRP